MNSLYTLALRQSTALHNDLKQLHDASPTPAQHTQLTTALATFDRTIDDYDQLARREIIDSKRDKALQRIQHFRQEHSQLRKEYDRVKNHQQQQKTANDRSELFNGGLPPTASTSSIAASHSYGASTSSRAFTRPGAASSSSSSSAHPYASPDPYSSGPSYGGQGGSAVSIPMGGGAAGAGGGGGGGQGDYTSSIHNNARTNYALREHDFMQQTGATLDAYLAQGQAVLGNLANQRDVMKGTQRRLLSAANTLGLSRETISFIERRTKADYYILLGGGAFTLFCFYLILKYFG
ncbi:hypothetical protein JCM8097_005021 [Rhodosporidiobolus ruineniae]